MVSGLTLAEKWVLYECKKGSLTSIKSRPAKHSAWNWSKLVLFVPIFYFACYSVTFKLWHIENSCCLIHSKQDWLGPVSWLLWEVVWFWYTNSSILLKLLKYTKNVVLQRWWLSTLARHTIKPNKIHTHTQHTSPDY